jgi:formyltetrahydrofolate synthetase
MHFCRPHKTPQLHHTYKTKLNTTTNNNTHPQAKIEAIAASYGADGVTYSPEADAAIARYERLGLNNLPICMAKTQYSFSHDPKLKGAPSGFTLPVRDVRAAAGAGFIYPLIGERAGLGGDERGLWRVCGCCLLGVLVCASNNNAHPPSNVTTKTHTSKPNKKAP